MFNNVKRDKLIGTTFKKEISIVKSLIKDHIANLNTFDPPMINLSSNSDK